MRDHSVVMDVPVARMREAAVAWRTANKPGLLWRVDSSIHDRVDDLIDELERLRDALEVEALAKVVDNG